MLFLKNKILFFTAFIFCIFTSPRLLGQEILNNGKAENLEVSADIFFNDKDFSNAKDIYLKLLTQKISKKQKFKYYERIADIYALQNNYEESLEYYRNALTLYSKKPQIHSKIGDIFSKNDLYNLAETSFEKALKIDKNWTQAQKGICNIYYNHGLYDKAAKYCSEIIQKENIQEYVLKFAVCCRKLKNIDLGIETIKNFMDKNGRDKDSLFLYALLQYDKKEYFLAKNTFLKVLEYDDKDFQIYLYLAKIYAEEKDFSKAIETLKKASILNPNSAVIDLLLAESFYKTKNHKDAKIHANNACRKAQSSFIRKQAEKAVDFLNQKV
jgi:tetratricopeptide (TPR) repeat protein